MDHTRLTRILENLIKYQEFNQSSSNCLDNFTDKNSLKIAPVHPQQVITNDHDKI